MNTELTDISNKPNRLDKEIALIPLLLATLLISAITGITTHLYPDSGSWEQWTYLIHSVCSSIFFVVILIYTFHHFRRITGVRRSLVIITGLISAIILYLVAFTGLFIIFFGLTESRHWIFNSHVILSYASLAVLILHLLTHRYSYNKRSMLKEFDWFQTIKKQDTFHALTPVIFTLTFIALISLIYESFPSPYQSEPVIQPYELPYGQHPFRPSETETNQEKHFVDIRQIAGSDKCGACHVQIFDEWKESIHSQAASDPSYVSNINLLAKSRGIASTRYCEGCHAPVALLTGQLTKGGQHGGEKNTLAHVEGVGCMSCHGIERAVHLKGVASYEFQPANDYLFASSDNFVATKIHNFLIQIHPQEHNQTMSRPILKKPELCATCHVQFIDKNMNNWGWIQLQNEYSAWLGSQFSGQNEQTFARQEVVRCQDCHFPLTPGSDPSANNQNEILSHRTLGANTAIPYLNNDIQQLLLTKRFLQSNKVSMSIEKPWRTDATHSSLYVDEKIRARQETPHYYYLGEEANIKVTTTNVQVGHNFPGGSPDINEVWIYFRVSDAENKIIFESGSIDEKNEVDPSAYFYRTIPVDKDGNHVWRHDLFRKTGESYRNVIPAGASDVTEYTFTVPYWAKGPLTISALLRYRKFNQRYARWALKDDNINLPITDMARGVVSVPLRIRPEVEKPDPGLQ